MIMDVTFEENEQELAADFGEVHEVGGGNPGGGIKQETDPTVPAWAKQPQKPTYTAEEVGAQPKGDYVLRDELPESGIPIPETAEVGQTIVVKAVDENGKPTEWECADIDSPDEYVTLFHKKFEVDVANTDEWGGEYFMDGRMHFWATDLDRNDIQADGLYVRIHAPKQTENIVSSGEIKIYVGKGKPTSWLSWGGHYQPQPYIGHSSFIQSNGQEVWAKWDYDLRTRTLTSTVTANLAAHGNFRSGQADAIAFEKAVAKNNWDYWSGVEIDLTTGTLPAGTEILIYARKLNPKKVPNIPKWGVYE